MIPKIINGNKSFIILIAFTILRISYADPTIPFSDDDYCTAENLAMTNLFSQVFQCLNANQNLTQHILILNDKIHSLEKKLEETSQKLELHIKNQQLLQQPLKTSPPKDVIVIQRRQDGSVDFYRNWSEYKTGFGDVNGEFFIGLEKLHKLTNSHPYALLIVLEDWENQRRYARYDNFVIGSELEKYELKELGKYSGTAGDSLATHLNEKFSTKDQENDRNEIENCAVQYTGAWWYQACFDSNLNGRYLRGNVGAQEIAQGIHWRSFRGVYYSLKFVEMSLHPKGF